MAEKETKVEETKSDTPAKTPAASSAKTSSSKKEDVPSGMIMVSEDTLKQMQEQIQKLNAVADVGRLQRYEQIHERGEIIPVVRINLWQGKPVMRWRMDDNVSEVDTRSDRNILIEKQTIRLWLEDDSDVLVDYLEWHRKKYSNQKPAEIVGKKVVKLKDDEIKDKFRRTTTIYTVQFEDGKEMDIDERYVN